MDFPKLKSGAVTQYPSQRGIEYRTEVLRFVDGGEQRYRESAGPRRRWSIRLDLLDDREAAAVETFFRAERGRKENFSFTDPWSGVAYSSCSLGSDELEMEWRGEGRCRTALIVVENQN